MWCITESLFVSDRVMIRRIPKEEVVSNVHTPFHFTSFHFASSCTTKSIQCTKTIRSIFEFVIQRIQNVPRALSIPCFQMDQTLIVTTRNKKSKPKWLFGLLEIDALDLTVEGIEE